MNFAKKMTLTTLFLAATCFSAAAQDRVIKFKLTQESRIGSATLPAGDYRMVVYSDPRMLAIVSPETRHGASIIALPTSYVASSFCTSASLTFIPNGNSLDLKSVCFGDSEMALYFPAVRSKKSEVAAHTTDAAALAGAQ